MRKNLLFVIVMLTGLVISMTACILGEDIDTLRLMASNVINIADIEGVTAPSTGGTPVRTIKETPQYNGTVTWFPEIPTSGTFAASTQYMANITLKPKEGYVLQGVKANFFKVAGTSKARNSANSGVITVTFPLLTPSNRIEYYWVDQHDSLVTSSGGITSITTGSKLTITPQLPQGEGYVVKKWYVNGVDTGQSGSTYTFSITAIGKHTVDLFLEKNSKLYNTSITITVKDNLLTANTWADGNITSLTDEQWFKFTTGSNGNHYIYVNFGTLNASNGLTVQAYTSNNLSSSSFPSQRLNSDKTYTSLSIISGQTYYIKVTPYNNSNYTGTYQITFNTSGNPPLPNNASTATLLTANTWADGTVSSTGEQWFKFYATTSTSYSQYIHASFVSLSSSYGINVQVYNSSGGTVSLYQSNLKGSNASTNLNSVRSGQTYYIKVTPYNNNYTGTYQIAFNTSSTPPVNSGSGSDLNYTTLTANTWANGSITTSSTEQLFKFTATASPQYIHINFVSFDGILYNGNIYAGIYDSNFNDIEDAERLSTYGNNYFSRYLIKGQTYYIYIGTTSSYYPGYGTYQVAFNTSSTPPKTSDSGSNSIGSEANPIPLSNGTWNNGSITSTSSSSAVWYSFNVTSGNTYNLWWNDSDDGDKTKTLDIKVDAYSNGTSIFTWEDSAYNSLKTFIAKQTGTVKLKVTPYCSGATGTFAIVYSTAEDSTRPR